MAKQRLLVYIYYRKCVRSLIKWITKITTYKSIFHYFNGCLLMTENTANEDERGNLMMTVRLKDSTRNVHRYISRESRKMRWSLLGKACVEGKDIQEQIIAGVIET